MAQDACARARPKARCLPGDTSPALPRRPATAPTASIEARESRDPAAKEGPYLGTQRATTKREKGLNIAGERQRAVTVRQYHVPLCLLSRSRMKFVSSNLYTGSAAVGEPTCLQTGGMPTPLKLQAGR